MPGLMITEFENVEMEPDKGTIDQNKSKQLMESNSKQRYKNLNIGDDDEYIDASKKNRDVSDVKGGVKGGEPKGNELETINKIQQNGENCRTDKIETPKPPPKEDEKKKQILGVDSNKCHVADDTGLNEFQKQIIFSAVWFLLLQNEYDTVWGWKDKKSFDTGVKKQWEKIGPERGYTKHPPLYPKATPLQHANYHGYKESLWNNRPPKNENYAWCANLASAIHFHALVTLDFIPDPKYSGNPKGGSKEPQSPHIPKYCYSGANWGGWVDNPFTIQPQKINAGTAFTYSAGAHDVYAYQANNGCPNGFIPKPGSIFYRPKHCTKPNPEDCGTGHAGIVVYVDPKDESILTIEGNAGDDCKIKKYNKNTGSYPWARPNKSDSPIRFKKLNKTYFAHVFDWDVIKWKSKSPGLDLTKQLSSYHPVLPFSKEQNLHLNKHWTNPLELIKALVGTFWYDGGGSPDESDR